MFLKIKENTNKQKEKNYLNFNLKGNCNEHFSQNIIFLYNVHYMKIYYLHITGMCCAAILHITACSFDNIKNVISCQQVFYNFTFMGMK